jgi:hypothetical protein
MKSPKLQIMLLVVKHINIDLVCMIATSHACACLYNCSCSCLNLYHRILPNKVLLNKLNNVLTGTHHKMGGVIGVSNSDHLHTVLNAFYYQWQKW